MTVYLGAPLSGKTTRLVHEFRQHLAVGVPPNQVLCLSFFSTNATAIRQALQPASGEFLPWVTTVQRFQSFMLGRFAPTARLPRRAREISPAARGLLLRQAWRGVNGALWQAPGALGELVGVIDWISRNR